MKNPFKKFSLQVTFFTSFIAISAVLIALLGITSYYITNREVVNETISSRILLLNEINKQIDYQLQAIEYDALVVASNPTIQHYLEEQEHSYERIQKNDEIIDLLSRFSYIKHAIHSVQLYASNSTSSAYRGASGVFAYSIIEQSPAYADIQHADSAWLGAHRIEVGDYLSINDEVISFYRKVLSASGKELGILVFNMKLSYMNELISAGSADGSRYVFDGSMRLIVEAHGEETSGVPFEQVQSELVALMEQKDASNHDVIESFGAKQLLIWNEQARTQWIAMDMIPWQSITEGSRQIQQTILLAVLICIQLAIYFALLLGRQFITPIRSLVKVMAKLKSGKMNSRVQNDYENEFGYLNGHFNSMAAEIEDLINQLNVQNQKKREAELKVLQEQMNPHFLYNTLDSMNWHAISIGANDISHMLSLLGKMMRIGLSSGKAIIPVAKEVEHLSCYVELQKIRYKHYIEFDVQIAKQLHACYIPKITLQPLVENAIIHGFHSRRKGRIDISGWIEGEQMKLRVKDNGHGFSTDSDIFASEHHGLRNVQERIQLYYGMQYGLHIESEPDAGTTVTITLPLAAEEINEQHDRKGGALHND
ncbi:histidine kinase [Paenibacillus montaniterrae]|uniref:Histidine kinase n=1 Tax=Paenibacillus montaniterrae TaxID=429341 RepID=A0A920CTI1_9BACL|nr:sensor histidine kinase [Paenibacillus montaniterrae]GIP15922.1 histidine kinase [Paenibacillus montaniterrae]